MPKLPDNALAFDTETKGLNWYDPSGHAFLGTWSNDQTDDVGVFVGEQGREGAERYLAAITAGGAPQLLLAHNLKFDAHQTRESLGTDIFNLPNLELHDTDLMSRILLPEGQKKDKGGHGLKNLAKVFLFEDADAEEKAIIELYRQQYPHRKSMKHQGAYYEVWRAHPGPLEAYALKDTRYCYDIAAKFFPRFDADPKLWALYQMERQVQRVLYRAEARGVATDQAATTHLKTLWQGKEKSAAAACEVEIGFVPEGEGSQEALADALISKGVQLTELTDKGNIAVNDKTLSAWEWHPAVKALKDWRRSQKMLQTYIARFDGVEVMHPDFQQAEAWTGRMSCRNPNMQNLPKRTDVGLDADQKLRSMIVPRKDHYFVVADFEAIEMRVLAHYLGVPWYRKLVAEGDPHAYTASVIWGGKPEDYYKGTPKRFLRDIAKHSTFAITYGAGAPKVRETINKLAPPEYRVDIDWVKDPNNQYDSPPQAKRIRNAIVSAIPGYDHLAGNRRRQKGVIARQVESQGYVRTIGGRKNPVNPEKAYVGLNALIQGSAADIMKLAAVNLSETAGHPLLFVHDEVLMEYPNDYDPDKAVAEVVEAMESSIDLKPALAVEAHVTTESYAHV